MADMKLSELQSICEELKIRTAALTELHGSLEDQGIDSLDKASLIFALEKRFQIAIADSDYDSLSTPADIMTLCSQE